MRGGSVRTDSMTEPNQNERTYNPFPFPPLSYLGFAYLTTVHRSVAFSYAQGAYEKLLSFSAI